MMDNPQPAMLGGASRNALHDLARAIGGTVVDRDHFVVVVIEFEQASQRLFDVSFSSFLAGTIIETRGLPDAATGLRFHSGFVMLATLGMPIAASMMRENQASASIVPAIQ